MHYKSSKGLISNWLVPLEANLAPLGTKDDTKPSRVGLSKVPLRVLSLLELVALEVLFHPLLIQHSLLPFLDSKVITAIIRVPHLNDQLHWVVLSWKVQKICRLYLVGFYRQLWPWSLRAWPHHFLVSYLANPNLEVHLAFPPDKVVPSWAIKVAWKLMPQKSHSPLGKEKNFLQELKILEIHPYLLRYSCELEFLGTIFG